ncbi:hypothetical protein [Thalassobacillus devorans]|uniref:hypothetical protein n=1 Tax=Thalassobacillus devorans TaxID=279813 RepID=UPI00048B0F2B|nr:hypothetical protein [Thalassobacillus devorans]
MKKFVIGVLSLGIAATSGVTGVQAHSDSEQPKVNSEQHMEMMKEMREMMQETNAQVNYGQVKKAMEEVKPEMTNTEIKEMMASMHGTHAAKPSSNFEPME